VLQQEKPQIKSNIIDVDVDVDVDKIYQNF
jgi:hypothetical protein